MKKYIVGASIAIVCSLIVYHILFLQEVYHACRPVSQDLGIWSKYEIKPDGLLSLILLGGSGYDQGNSSVLYQIPFKILNKKVPQLTESYSSKETNISGLVHPLSAVNADGVDHYRRYFPDAPYIETEGGLYWLEDLASYNVYIGKPNASDQQPLWDRRLGSCINLPKNLPQYRPYGSDALNGLEYCNFDFNYKTLNIEYNFKNSEFVKYELMEEFLISELVCKM